jgi:nitrogen-specific signal transduction histidine kinase
MRFVPSPRGVCVLLLDTTSERRSAEVLARTEEQLRHAQKMEAIGRLAGGVAHEFNNALSVILCCAEFILEELEPNHALREDLEQIRAAGQRAVALTRQLLAFSRQTTTQPQLLDINEVVAGTEKVLGRLLGADISLTMSRASSVWPVKADPGQLVQALLNLAVNARDAMPMGGTLAIETKNIELDEEHARNHPGVVPGQYVMIAVTDNGIGMDEATRARAFEPFFTTKDNGKGTGLGLSIVCGTMRQAGGHIRLDSEIGKGSRFELYFPRAVDAPVTRSSVTLAPLPERGTETVLLVEDDEQVRAIAAGALRRCGYHVLEASNAGEACLIYEECAGAIDLLLTDVVLPRVSGARLAAKLAATRPELKVLYMSGYPDEAMLPHGISESGSSFLQKPITPEALVRKVREVLDRPFAYAS